MFAGWLKHWAMPFARRLLQKPMNIKIPLVSSCFFAIPFDRHSLVNSRSYDDSMQDMSEWNKAGTLEGLA